jgi:hypothetical protein
MLSLLHLYKEKTQILKQTSPGLPLSNNTVKLIYNNILKLFCVLAIIASRQTTRDEIPDSNGFYDNADSNGREQ